MRSLPLLTIAAVLLLAAPQADAQGRRQRVPPSGESRGDSGGGGGTRSAVPRDGGSARDNGGSREGRGTREAQPAPAPQPQAQPQPQARPRDGRDGRDGRDDRNDGYGRQAAPRDRDRDGNNRPGIAVPRRDTRGPIYVLPRRGYYNDRFYYPRGSFGFSYRSGFRPYGFGYYYYDPYVWSSRGVYYYGGPRYGYPAGELRLDLPQRDAEVYIDGYYAGVVDDFDGVFQALTLEEGPHTVEIVQPGYETLEFQVRVRPGEKVHYRGDLYPERP